jgi:subtilisin family serine protease
MLRIALTATLAVIALGAWLPGGAAAAPADAPADATLVQLRRASVCTAAASLAVTGARLVVPELRVWRVRGERALLVALERRDAIALTQSERNGETALVVAQPPPNDPLSADEWWRAAVGIADLTPPGAGVPVTVVDSGIDVMHPEFAGRPNTETLNPQEPAPVGGEHGTAVASLVGAPANGRGIVGVYPAAILRSWDSARGAGTRLATVEIVNGILEASRRGQGVINLSLGGTERDRLIEQAVAQAVARGSLVVAASGNDGEGGSPLGYPAVLPHVLTVAATNRSDQVASFSSRSPYVDLAAPGADITVATTRGAGWQASSGTSFAAPLVSGAAAWVWTARPDLDSGQVAEVLRRSARDLGAPGRDRESGFGLLDVPAALAHPAPIRDPLEPNDDVDLVDPEGADSVGLRPLTRRGRPTARLAGRLDALEDPRDVYRVWVPRNHRLVVTAVTEPDQDVDISLWRQGTLTAVTRLPGGDRLAVAAGRGPTETLRYRNAGAGRIAYLVVAPHKGVMDVAYRLSVRARVR